jgi:RimJ/RimL family protein N-acetyltransferase
MIEPVTLENARVRLSPLILESAGFLEGIAAQKGLVSYSPSDIETPEKLRAYISEALTLQQHDLAIPFIIFDKQTGEFAGCTRYMNIDWINKVLHIGSTWIGREFQGSGLNRQMKFLMLQHAFETMKFEKVEFRIDERNTRSRRAVEKLGAVLEGILRKNVYLLDGYKRNTCCYGILREEWDVLKPGFLSN